MTKLEWMKSEIERLQKQLREKNERILNLERENAKLRAGYPLALVNNCKVEIQSSPISKMPRMTNDKVAVFNVYQQPMEK